MGSLWGGQIWGWGYKKTRLWGNFRRDKIAVGRMGRIVGRSRPSNEKKDIVCGGGGGDWILWRPKGRVSLYLITEGGAQVLGR